jgi:hypothetical protein
VRTTVTIDDALYTEAKVVAAQSQNTVGELINGALKYYLAELRTPHTIDLPPLPQWTAGRVRPGIDINDSSSLLALLDSPSTDIDGNTDVLR